MRVDETVSLVACRVGDIELGIELIRVQEINRLVEATFVPRLDPEIRGLINLRGSLVTVLDLGTILRGESVEVGRGTRNIIVELRGERYGLLVDEVGDVIEATAKPIESLPSHVESCEARWFAGLVQREDGVVLALDIDAVLARRFEEPIES
ncbi:MAG: chemotaxis protein CheW [Planctomycetes bacterium]|nr:chemotaxis protein CheW [Planctomycetota bacterium]